MTNTEEAKELSRLVELLPDYPLPEARYDELFSGGEQYLRLWHRILTSQIFPDEHPTGMLPRSMDAQGLVAKWIQNKRFLAEYAAGSVSESDSRRVGELDPIPMIMTTESWSTLASGIAQRAKLLDLILKDIYGPQKLIQNKLLPHELVFGNEAYLSSMRNTLQANESIVSLYAAQLSRDATGRWHVIADRTQGPSGCGYAVENRIAISRVLQEEFRDLRVQRSAPFFAALRESIARKEISHAAPQRTVLLTPGIRSTTYFEDAYLARYLNYTLAQSEDLTVRGGQVFLKTLGGLVQITNILRRVPDLECDPLELAASAIGVPGLCQAIRNHQVVVSNHVGSGLAEAPAFMATLPRLCNELLGEDLLLPSWPTWWCGDPKSREYVLENLDGLNIRDAFVRHTGSRLIGSQCSDEQKNEVRRSLASRPWNFIATLPHQFSTTPCWQNNRVVAWPVVIRVFAASVGDQFQVLPGGIGRASESPTRLNESLGSGHLSKDIWVLADAPVKLVTLRKPPERSIELRRSSYELPSRVAEHLYWLGRWTERAEGMVRHARFCANRLSGEIDFDSLSVWQTVVDALHDTNESHAIPRSSEELLNHLRSQVVRFVFDESNLSSLAAAMVGVRRNASLIRDRLSLDSWQILSRLDISVLFPYGDDRRKLGDVQLLLNQMLNYLTAFAGLVAESMTRGPGWQFLTIGRRLERVSNSLRLLEKLLVPCYPRLTPLLESLLDIMDSSMTYRLRYMMSFEIEPVLDLLVTDQTNPRGIAFQLAELDEHLRELIQIDRTGIHSQRLLVQQARATLRLCDLDAISIVSPDDRDASHQVRDFEGHVLEYRPELMRLLDRVGEITTSLSDYISERFFTHTAAARQLRDSANQ